MKKYYRIFISVLCILACLFSLVGCKKKPLKEGEFFVYYLNMEVTKLVPEPKEIENETDIQEAAKEFIELLSTNPGESGLRQAIPENVKVNKVELRGYQILIDFNKTYGDMSTTEEVLVRAAIVRTICQLGSSYTVSITIEGKPLLDSAGNVIGNLTPDNFVENPGEQITSSINSTITLYFADKSGTELIEETRSVRHSSNVSMEKLVVEQLIKGPEVKGHKATVSNSTKLINISTVDGVCYVSFDETIQHQDSEISEAITVYSIVNSLTKVKGVEKVQISINGDTKGKLRYNYDLSKFYEYNDELVGEGEPINSEKEIEGN